MKLIIASGNKGKVREYKELLRDCGFDEVLSLKDAGITCEPEETGSTFEENAAIKARALFELIKGTGAAALADDSGLEVDALDGEPGVYSARWLGLNDDKAKNDELIKKQKKKTGRERSARFVCVIHFIKADGSEITVRGECEGEIGFEPLGENGFGYDPIFMFGDRSFAQIGAEEKNAVSHRGKALRKLVSELTD